MKKEKLKKILATGAMGIMALAMPFALTGCDKNDDINVVLIELHIPNLSYNMQKPCFFYIL